ncbi:16S rRNA (adenine(1518)-N(6)/adenine(1519)-N(6))-dimethyltransferase RsmA [Ligilactobacillus agilis]|jgi:16S rRNA (adenine1518-N6/adenine1519-N6)-dimethyltransferase|uniref:Ribosomal RNA small subunit methyltransferase A n=1 Tax=Ligilactobacillus agilis TaxID=1601 RepID=A0A6F9Y064_9LACO|nr:16S rRNA (adenine(1518)-N(6)/adenine(1519)-N(6))-dimethyltransferase RsmA [Ligilactobacillus agilis]MBL1056033.1 16S rRNA (adenine(1518)-N(6)/adenine(1519)-N(6))-dimethyltransferase RsmA [Ligilactobacillus agilis]MCI5762054.1 16S rRNA (adenine(1518)-N(6)/adenine(1519)-N(6))-dimethyltransferase RsmA [Ligilactobacillus agilis]MDO4597813.1 16S rRNA (adenine(1518)-N(6)/adenine(1519)-N(6))-dimethyltransferase RsmA [Ligilactobacillus agilis]NJE33193.1 16S rRNA (adenine(1518)-N(6)/adenine(1519)-N(6
MDNNLPEIASPTRTRAIMETYGLTFKKSLGQNFLTDINVLKKIVAAAEVSEADDVIEIGPGIGALTEQLAKSAHQVLALEIDDRLLPVLKETLAPYPNVEVIHQDILKANLKELIAEHFDGQHRLKIVANLPYYITTPIIMHLLATELAFDQIVVMMQKEVANRLAAQPGSKDYGSLSIGVQYEMDCQVAFIVPKTVFVPQPKVDSAIISLTKKKAKEYQPQDERFFHQLVRGAFMHRRKSLWNNLQGLYGKQAEVKEKLSQALAQAEIEPSVRAERLTIADFVRLADCLLATGVKVK